MRYCWKGKECCFALFSIRFEFVTYLIPSLALFSPLVLSYDGTHCRGVIIFGSNLSRLSIRDGWACPDLAVTRSTACLLGRLNSKVRVKEEESREWFGLEGDWIYQRNHFFLLLREMSGDLVVKKSYSRIT